MNVAIGTAIMADYWEVLMDRFRSREAFFLAAILYPCGFNTANAVVASASFIPLGKLSGGASGTSMANAISGDGNVVVGRSTSSSGEQAFRWTASTGMAGIGDLPGGTFASEAYGVSYDGSVIVGSSSSTRSFAGHPFYHEPFRWVLGSGMTGLGYLTARTDSYGAAYDVSADGHVVVGSSQADFGERPFRWTQTQGMQDLGHLPSSFSNQNAGFGVSEDGAVVVGFSTSINGREAFRWTAATGMNSLGFLPGGPTVGNYSSAFDLSSDGSVIIGSSYSANGIEAFRWTADSGIVGLGDLPGGFFSSDARAISADGSVIVGSGTPGRGNVAVIWRNGGPAEDLKSLLLSLGADQQLIQWTLHTATDISADGRTIVGYGSGPHGTEAWMARLPIPEPSTAMILGASLVLPLYRSRPRL